MLKLFPPHPPSTQTGDRHPGRSQVRLSQSAPCPLIVPTGGRDRPEDHSGHAALGRPNDADEDVCPQSHGQEKGSAGQDGRRNGPKRDHPTPAPVAVFALKPAWILVQNGAVGDRPWVILPCLHLSDFQLNALKPVWILDETNGGQGGS